MYTPAHLPRVMDVLRSVAGPRYGDECLAAFVQHHGNSYDAALDALLASGTIPFF
jgi:hypothetical protein